MPEPEVAPTPPGEPATNIDTAVNILTSPREAFDEIERRPSKLFPIIVILGSMLAVMAWYFAIVDFDWYIDDTLSQTGMPEDARDDAREAMLSMSRTNFALFGVMGSALGILVIWLLQSAYLSLVSALNGDRYKFTHWFSLTLWTGLPYVLSALGIAVTILLNSNGQLSVYDLDPLTLSSLGMQSDNGALQALFSTFNLTMLWSLVLMVMAYQYWLKCSRVRAAAVVLAPPLIIFGAWIFFALS